MKWDPYRLNELPEEARADVIKTLISETESTKRKQVEEHEKTRREALGTEGHFIVRGLFVAMLALLGVSGAILANAISTDTRDVRLKALQPFTCPPPASAVPPAASSSAGK